MFLSRLLRNAFPVAGIAVIATVGALNINAQSSDVRFPTPLTVPELSGSIKPRAVGDNRQTTQYFTLSGGQGDLFINVVANEMDADIDIFAEEGMRPLTKIVIFASSGTTETGRLVYLRKPEKLILRIVGRANGDAEGTYRIKFAGEFVAAAATEDAVAEPVAKLEKPTVRVTSAGTIIETQKVEPKPVVEPEPEKTPDDSTTAKAVETSKRPRPVRRPGVKAKPVVAREKKLEETETTDETATTPPRKVTVTRPPKAAKPSATATAKAPRKPAANSPAKAAADDPDAQKPAGKVDPLASIKLVVLFKDGKRFERPMSEIERFSVNDGFLTIITKVGRTGRYSLLEVASVTIQ